MRPLLAGIALLVGIGATSALAHHPFEAEFDWKKPITITGTVTKFEWKDPHSVVEIEGKDESGTEARWTVELGPMAQLSRAGWTRSQLKNGDKVSVDGWLARNGAKRLSAKSVTPSGGRELFAASSFFDMGRPAPQTARTGSQRRQPTGTTGKEPAPTPRR